MGSKLLTQDEVYKAEPSQLHGLIFMVVASLVAFFAIIASVVLLPNSFAAITPASFVFVSCLSGSSLFLVALMRRYRAENVKLKQTLSKVIEAKNELQADYESSQLALLSEPQILMRCASSEHHNLQVLSSTFENEELSHLSPEEFLNYHDWLTAVSSDELTDSLETLETNGEEFDLIIITQKGHALEAIGRIAGDQALLKIRDLAGAGAVQQQLKEELDLVLGELLAARQLLDALPMPVWFKGIDHKLSWVNESYARAVGIKDKSLVISANAEFLEQRHIETISETLGNDQIFHTKTRMILGGERRFFDLIVVPNNNKSAGIAIDVEDETIASENLQRHLQAFDETLERVGTAVVIFDNNRDLQYYNQAYMDLWEFDRKWLDSCPSDSEVLDRLRLNRQLPEQSDYNNWKNQLLALSETAPDYEDWWYLRDGRILYVTGKLGPDDTITYCYENMTEQYNLESKYNALIRMQGATLNALNEGVAVFSSNGRLKLSNPAFAKLWNLNKQFMEESPHIDQVIAACQPLYKNNNFWDKVLEAVTVLDDSREYFTDKLSRFDGMVLANHVEPLPNGATMITFHDITELEKTAQILAERNEALQSADNLKNSFISNVSYDLRTPLTAIIGFTEMLMQQEALALSSEKQYEYLHDIHHSGQILESSINDILILATIDAGKLELEFSAVEFEDIVTGVLEQFNDIIDRKQLQILTNIDKVHKKVFIADPKRVRQILAKILSNAVAFTPSHGEIIVTAHSQNEQLIFGVKDSGKGMAEENLEKIFNRFENTLDTVRGGNDEGGVGIGLAVARELVELHGGLVKVASKIGEGTIVQVQLPLDSRKSTIDKGSAKHLTIMEDTAFAASEHSFDNKALRA